MDKIQAYSKLIATVLSPVIEKGRSILAPNDRDMYKIDEAIASLAPKETKVVRGYFGLDQEKVSTDSLARQFEVTTSRVYQIRKKAIRKLKHPRKINAFLRCVEDRRLKAVEEDNQALSEEISRLREIVGNAVHLLYPLVRHSDSTSDALIDFEKDLKTYLAEKEKTTLEFEEDLKIYLKDKDS